MLLPLPEPVVEVAPLASDGTLKSESVSLILVTSLVELALAQDQLYAFLASRYTLQALSASPLQQVPASAKMATTWIQHQESVSLAISAAEDALVLSVRNALVARLLQFFKLQPTVAPVVLVISWTELARASIATPSVLFVPAISRLRTCALPVLPTLF
jgi:hypothetical protein